MKTPHEFIKVAAYFLWERAGRPSGYDLNFWLEAEYQLNHTTHHHAVRYHHGGRR